MNEEQVKELLHQVKYPGFSRDIISFGLVRGITSESGRVTVQLGLTSSDPAIPEQIETAIRELLLAQDSIEDVEVNIEVKAPSRPAPSGAGNIRAQTNAQSKIRYIVAVASGKGGVGKSTFSVNLACALNAILSRQGKPKSVGLMDCDVYGPSIPLMIGLNAEPQIEGNYIQPLENFDIRVMSMGLLVDETTPIVWRGPMVTKTIQQFAQNVAWGALEVLVVDLPPGTGDVQLSLSQIIPLDGAIIITTPQIAAVQVAHRGALMFEKVNVPLFGVVENMSHWVSPEGKEYHLFGKGGGARVAASLETELLGQVPLDQEILQGGDHGIPAVIGSPESVASKVVFEIAERLLHLLAEKEKSKE